MDIIQFIAQFFYRIRYWLLWGGFIVTALVAYFTQFLPFSYTVNSNIYAGVTNVTNIDGSKIENISSTFDNLINIAKSKSTLEKVSLRLLATNLVYGEEWQDNMYIQAKHYRQLLQHTPKEVLALVDRSSLDKTVGNLQAYRQESAANFVYSMFSRPTEFYSFHALEQITVKRLGTRPDKFHLHKSRPGYHPKHHQDFRGRTYQSIRNTPFQRHEQCHRLL